MSRIERWLAPGLLVGIALCQILLTFAADLTPWKGGGFGMFSSIDAPDLRVVWCEGTTSDGEIIRIDAVLAVGRDEELGMRAMPKERALHHLGHLLMGLELVPVEGGEDVLVTKLLNENPSLRGKSQEDSDTPPFHRPIKSTDPLDERVVRLDSVRLRWWKVGYKSGENQIQSRPLGEEVEIARTPG